MASNRMDKLFSRLEQSSSTYADRATQLSEAILEFEERLHSVMRGKFSAYVGNEDPQVGFVLGYDRFEGQWRLCFAASDQDRGKRPLQESAVRYKILAVALFEALLKEILDKQEEQTEELRAALEGLPPYLNVGTDQKGGE